MPDKWRKLVITKDKTNKDHTLLHRRHLELAVLSQVALELRSADIYAQDGDEYDDHRLRLVSREVYQKEIENFGKMVGLPTHPAKFVTQLKEKFKSLAKKTDTAFPDNEHVELTKAGLVIRKHEAKKKPKGFNKIDKLIKERMPEPNIVDVLVDTENWLNLSRDFKPLSGLESKIDDPRRRFIMTLFCYGCNLGPSQTARSMTNFSRKQIAWLNLQHISEKRLDKAIVKVVNAYNKFVLPKSWGSGKSASVDGTKWDVYEENLLSEYHIRYGGYGGIGYYHVSDMYIALFSHFIPCGVHEAIYILDGLMKNQSDIKPDTIHGDSHAQSSTVFGLAHLLGIKLMPRIKNIKDLTFYRPEKGIKYEHINMRLL